MFGAFCSPLSRLFANIDFEDFAVISVTSTEKFSRCQAAKGSDPIRPQSLAGPGAVAKKDPRRLDSTPLHATLSLGHKEILVSQVPIIQGRGTKSKLAFYVSNRYDTILILCFCMPIKRFRDKPSAWICVPGLSQA